MKKNPRVLVIDDDEDMRLFLAKILQRHGYRADLAASGDEGLLAFSKTDYALVVTDIRMPGLPVSRMIRTMAALNPRVITGQATKAEITATRVRACLCKPFDLEEFLDALRMAGPFPEPPAPPCD